MEVPRDLVDPICLAHHRRKSEHWCVQCCLCFKDLQPEDCHRLPNGMLEDVCNDCAKEEQANGEPRQPYYSD